jgi:hypothetical protein
LGRYFEIKHYVTPNILAQSKSGKMIESRDCQSASVGIQVPGQFANAAIIEQIRWTRPGLAFCARPYIGHSSFILLLYMEKSRRPKIAPVKVRLKTIFEEK